MLLRLLTGSGIGLFAVILLWWLKRLYNIIVNYRAAKRLGLPIIVCWFSWQDIWFGLFRPYLQWLAYLPFDLGTWITFSNMTWCVTYAYRPHYKHGHAICVVTPGQNEIWVDDPKAVSELLSNWKKWHKPSKFYRILEVFGKNVLTIEGVDWQRQRKIINSAFTEQSHSSVWQYTTKQAEQMVDVAFADGKAVTLFEVKKAVDTMTMHVLAAGIFGQDLSFESEHHFVAANHKRSFVETQRWILQHLLWLILFGNVNVPKFLRPLLPAKVKEVLATKKEYRQYMEEFVEDLQNKDKMAVASSNLITTIIKSNDEAREDKLLAEGRRMYLTDAELYGNLFVLNMAGFETTASTLGFTIPYLAAYPAVQDWLMEEVDEVMEGHDLNLCDEAFPKLTRTMAVMYETLRLRGALQFSFKISAENQVLELQDQSIIVPANTFVGLNMASVFRDPQYWGADSEEWRPSRWIEHDQNTGQELLKGPPEGTIFVPWTVGPRICPGKKFSQLEFTGTMLAILSQYRIDAVTKTGESEQQARDRVLQITSEVETRITPKIVRPHDASVKLTKRRQPR